MEGREKINISTSVNTNLRMKTKLKNIGVKELARDAAEDFKKMRFKAPPTSTKNSRNKSNSPLGMMQKVKIK